MQATVSTEITQEKVDKAVSAILEVLGKPENDCTPQSVNSFSEWRSSNCKETGIYEPD